MYLHTYKPISSSSSDGNSSAGNPIMTLYHFVLEFLL
ncbi:unnamed protein product [Gulo gulo]|uniref:Uncharacterized protein n=1 Tax=Gulo gulo TaxID=48420 RepID=A0A9X9Q9F9_GULGU|nr:unnamed protein product [Gulo gulo]